MEQESLHHDGEPALAGIRVVDFTHFVAGPFCTQLLGDLGAEVIKIENAARGDDFRRVGPQVAPGQSAPFLWTNRNKQGLALDLTNESGRDIAKALIAKADIVVENFTAGVMHRFGLDYESVGADHHPRLIYCTVSAFRRDGRFARRPGFDPMVQAEAGFMSLNGYPDAPPVRTGPAIMDISTSLMACNAVLAALAARSRTGRGQLVEVSLFDTAVTMLGFHAMSHLATGDDLTRFGNHSPDTAPMGLFQAADGPLYIACANDQTFRQLAVEVLGSPELAAPDYTSNADRVRNRKQLAAILDEALGRHPRQHWKEQMEAAGVPVGVVRTLGEAMVSEEMQDAGLLCRIPHPTAGTVPNIASPLRLHGTPVVEPVAAPLLGQHRDAILAGVLGYDAKRIDALAQAGAFGKKLP